MQPHQKMKVEIRTVPGGTMTTEGFINYMKHPLGFYMPVKLAFKTKNAKTMNELHPPKRHLIDGRLIYALPGGGEWISGSEYEKALLK